MKKKRFLAVITVISLILSMMPVNSRAAEKTGIGDEDDDIILNTEMMSAEGLRNEDGAEEPVDGARQNESELEYEPELELESEPELESESEPEPEPEVYAVLMDDADLSFQGEGTSESP